MMGDFTHCERCEQQLHIDELDAKPKRLDRWWWHLLPHSWAMWFLDRAAERGDDFDGLYCSWCYGPGYETTGKGA